MSQRLLTPDEVAERLQVSRLTVMGYLRKGTLRGIKVGRLWRVEEGELTRFLKGRGSSPYSLQNDAPVASDASRIQRAETVKEDPYAGMTQEDIDWLEGDFGPPLPPWDHEKYPLPKGLPVKHIPGVGLVIEGRRRHGK